MFINISDLKTCVFFWNNLIKMQKKSLVWPLHAFLLFAMLKLQQLK